MRRLIVILFFLILIAAVALTVYAYVVDLPPPGGEIVTPAAGVGFSE